MNCILDKELFEVTEVISQHKEEEAERFWASVSECFDDDKDIHKLLAATFSAGFKTAMRILELSFGKGITQGDMNE